jgi:hypothetical protein
VKQKHPNNCTDQLYEKSARRMWYEVLALAISDLQHFRPSYRKKALAWLKSSDSDYALLVMGCNPEEARSQILSRVSSQLPAAA